jgi:hypothetical protein
MQVLNSHHRRRLRGQYTLSDGGEALSSDPNQNLGKK